MSLLKLLTEEQLTLFGLDKKDAIDKYLDRSKVEDMIDIDTDIKTLDDAKKSWLDVEEKVYNEVYDRMDIDPFDLAYEHIGQVISYVHNAIKDDRSWFEMVLKDEFDEEELTDVDYLLSDIIGEEPKEDTSVGDIIDLLYTVDIDDLFKSGSGRLTEDFVEFLVGDLNIERFVFEDQTEFFREIVLDTLHSEGGLRSDGESGIEEMWFHMETNLESINGVDHIYAERMIKFSTPEELLKYQSLGIYWSWAEEGGEAYSGSGSNTALFKAMIPLSSIDWEETFVINMYELAYEKEVRVKDSGGAVLLKRVEFEFESDYSLRGKVDSIIKTYFPNKVSDGGGYSYQFEEKVTEYFLNKEDSILDKSRINLNLEDNKYYNAYHEF